MPCATCGQITFNAPQLVDAVPAGMSGNHGITAIPIYRTYCDACLYRMAQARLADAAGKAAAGRRLQELQARQAAEHRALVEAMPANIERTRQLACHLIETRPQGNRRVVREAWTRHRESRRVFVELEELSPAWPIGFNLGSTPHYQSPPFTYGVSRTGTVILVAPACLPNYRYDETLRFTDDPFRAYPATAEEVVQILRQLETDSAAEVSEAELAPPPLPAGRPLTLKQLAEIQSYRTEIARLEAIWHISDRDPQPRSGHGADTGTVKRARATVARYKDKVSRLQGYPEP